MFLSLFATKATRASSEISRNYVSGGGKIATSADETVPRTSAVVSSAVDFISTYASQCRFKIVELDASGKEAPVKDKKLQAYFDTAPNPFTTWGDMLKLATDSLLLTGNTFLTFEKVGGNYETWFMQPSKMTVVPDTTNFIAGYQYDSKIDYTVAEMVHVKQNIVENVYYGSSVVRTLADELLLEGYSMQDLKDFYNNSSVGQGILETQDFVSDENIRSIRSQFADNFGLGKGRHSVLIAQGGLTYKQIKMSPRDAMLLDSLNISEDRVFRAFKLHKDVVGGIVSSSAGIKDLLKHDFNTAVRPILYKIADAIQLFLQVQFKKPLLRVTLDTTRVPELDDAMNIKADAAKILFSTGLISVDEGREMVGKTALNNANSIKHWLPSHILGNMPITLEDWVPGQQLSPTNQQPSPVGSTDPAGGTPNGVTN